jgi:hypothetical protein
VLRITGRIRCRLPALQDAHHGEPGLRGGVRNRSRQRRGAGDWLAREQVAAVMESCRLVPIGRTCHRSEDRPSEARSFGFTAVPTE